jgi:hypothetical protein
MKLIKEIIELLSSDTPNLNNALFKTKVLLHKLGEKNLVQWVNSELNGYSSIDNLPGYRILTISILGNISNRAWRYSSQPLLISHLDKELQKRLETTYLTQSIAVLESYAKDESGLRIQIPPEFYPSLSKGYLGGYNVENAWGVNSAGSMLQVINEVRSRLLDFILELSEKIPEEPNEDTMKEKSKEIGTSELFRNAVFGDNATIVVGDSNIQNIKNTILKNDFAALAAELKKYSVAEEDISSLKVAIESDKGTPDLTENKFGPKVRKWISGMLTKATDAVWDIQIGIAANLLTEALKAYYGF